MKSRQSGFTLVELAIVLLIVAILLGYTIALFPRQQELKQYRAVNQVMDEVIEAIIGFAQVNGRLPCPAQPNGAGIEDINGIFGCNTYAGFVPMNTLGLDGRTNDDSLLLDPWANPYRYYVTNADFDPLPDGTDNSNNISDFTSPGEMRAVGLVDSDGNGDIDLDGRYLICADRGAATDDACLDQDSTIFGRRVADGGGAATRYNGAPVVLLSMGKNWRETPVAASDELENRGATATPAALKGPTTNSYWLKNVAGGETTFVRRIDGMAADFDDVVRWVSPNILFSRMIDADQLP